LFIDKHHRLWSDDGVVDTLPREDAVALTPADFVARYERPGRVRWRPPFG
jgi:hypothetical protein